MIASENFIRRRIALVAQINAPIILTAHTATQQKSDMAYRFTQEPSFLYFTGITEPDWQLIFDGSDWLLVEPAISETQKLFDGHLTSDKAKQTSGINKVISATEAEVLLHRLAKKYKKIFTIGKDPMSRYYTFALNPSPRKLLNRVKRIFEEVGDCRPVVKKLRAIKSEEEIDAHQRAIDVTIDAFQEVKRALSSLNHEYEVEAHFNAAFRATGAGGHAYEPIVAGGAHACTLHYGENNDALPKNGLVLIDVGTQYEGYAADITRTFSVGTPLPREREIHAAVEEAHKKIINLIKPGLLFEIYQSEVDMIMKSALQRVGLLYSFDDTKTYRRYFPHAISHGLGIDVHESLGGGASFQPGMILTVEPGIYIPEEGIGVRIEDDILVTADGTRNLSAALPTSL